MRPDGEPWRAVYLFLNFEFWFSSVSSPKFSVRLGSCELGGRPGWGEKVEIVKMGDPGENESQFSGRSEKGCERLDHVDEASAGLANAGDWRTEGAQAGWSLRGRAQASYAAAGQPQGSSGGHSSGGLRGSPKPRPMMVITIVGHVATVSPGVKIHGSA